MSVTESISQPGGKTVSIPSRLILPAYTLAIFVSAFLLFSVQPLFAKMVLPKLGGSPAVWSVAMVFFQTMLLAGYAYAHLLTRFLSLRNASLIHMGVLITAFVFLPLAIPEGWTNPPESGQSFWLLGLFTMAVGLPFFAVAANSPLLQAWFSKTGHAHAADPYFLYGASNIGSFASLILYIVAFEPTMAVTSQSLAWTAGFALLAIMIGFAAMLALPRAGSELHMVQKTSTIRLTEGSLWSQRLTWVALAFIPSGLLVAVTAHISTDVAAAPFLWVIPLALFLLTFVVAFARKPIIGVKGAVRVVFVLSPVLLMKLAFGDISYPWLMLPAHLVFFFFAALLAHSLLVAQRPRAERLTEFYLWMSFGGVVGGAVTTLLSPVLFSSVIEYPLLIVATLFCMPGLYRAANGASKPQWVRLATLTLLMVFVGWFMISKNISANLDITRSFYGVVRVHDDKSGKFTYMSHGTTVHGAIAKSETSGRPTPRTYYHELGGIAATLFAKQQMLAGRPANMAVAGLGAGSILCHRKAGERWTSYEIDKAVVDAANNAKYFRFMSECGQSDPVIVGDARLTLANEPNGKFDYLLVDAFSSDSIPVHLLTVEAMELYKSKIAEDGVLAIHISNRHMELQSVVASLAKEVGLVGRQAIYLATPEMQKEEMILSSHVAVFARDEAHLGSILEDKRWKPLNPRQTIAWTDDFSNVPAAIWRIYSGKR